MDRTWKQNFLQNLFLGYLKLLDRTIKITWDETLENNGPYIFGFWHEDSFFMNLVLKRMEKPENPIDVIVTADARGDYIQTMLQDCGGQALRVPDGYQSFRFLQKILKNPEMEKRSIAVALDGPLGPRHEPKRLAFYLSQQMKKEFVGVYVTYSAVLRAFWRWDHYALPLPFSRIHVEMDRYGVVDKSHIPSIPISSELV